MVVYRNNYELESHLMNSMFNLCIEIKNEINNDCFHKNVLIRNIFVNIIVTETFIKIIKKLIEKCFNTRFCRTLMNVYTNEFD